MSSSPSPSSLLTASTFRASSHSNPTKANIILITTGSVASIKIPLIVQVLAANPLVSLQIVATKASLAFYTEEEVETAGKGEVKVWKDEDEWEGWRKVGDPILHIELRRWADIVLVIPCTANTLAKIANGICDNLATSLLRALPPQTPHLLLPATNTQMYLSPLTPLHLATARDVLGYEVWGPEEKVLACGDTGIGGMMEWREVVRRLEGLVGGLIEGKGREAEAEAGVDAVVDEDA